MLVVDGLNIDAGRTRIVENISFRIAAGQRVGLLGASGSGKSLTASAIIGHLPRASPRVVTSRSMATTSRACRRRGVPSAHARRWSSRTRQPR